MNERNTCRIWSTPAKVAPYDARSKEHIDSPRAGGKYDIHQSGMSELTNCDDRQKARLTTWLIDQRRLGVEKPIIDRTAIAGVLLTSNLPVHERVDRLLGYIGNESQHVGEEVPFNIETEALLYPNMIDLDDQTTGYWRNMKARAYSESIGVEELGYMVRYAKDQGWIEYRQGGTAYVVTVDGYGRLAELGRRKVDSSRESLNNPMFAVSRGRGGLDVKLDDIADRPGAALVTGYGANGRYPRRSASFPAVPPAAGRLLPCHPVA